jgi:Flp pilus assembly protein TadD
LKETFETASRLDPYNASFHFELSRIYAKLGETELSRESREKAISLFPSEPRFRLQGSPVSSSAN